MPDRDYVGADARRIERIIREQAAEIERLRAALQEARLQIEYLNEKYPATSTGVAAIAKIDYALHQQSTGTETKP